MQGGKTREIEAGWSQRTLQKWKMCKGMRDAKPPSEQTQLWIRHTNLDLALSNTFVKGALELQSEVHAHERTHTYIKALNESLQSSREAGCSPSGHIWVFQFWRACRTPANKHSLSQVQFVWRFVLVQNLWKLMCYSELSGTTLFLLWGLIILLHYCIKLYITYITQNYVYIYLRCYLPFLCNYLV